MLGKVELRILSNLEDRDTLNGVIEKTGLSKGRVSIATRNLENLGFIIRERRGRRIYLRIGNTLHASLLFDFLREYPSIPIEKILTHRRISMLSIIEYSRISLIAEIIGVSRQTIYNIIKDFLRYGILVRRKGYRINPRHEILKRFVSEYQGFINRMEMKKVDDGAVLLWERGPEFLMKTNRRIEKENYHLTATSAFTRFGLLFISSHNYYFYSKRDVSSASEVIIHTLLANSNSKTSIAYACLLYKKTKPRDLIKVSKIYGMENKASKIIKYVDEKQDFKDFPSREDYNELLKDYMV